jgi:hypothetical protein
MKAFFERYKKHLENPHLKALTPFKQWLINIVAKKKVEK